MNSKVWINKALSMCLIIVTIVAYSMVALAGTDKIAAELLTTGVNDNRVLVNGEAAQTGRSVFSSSTIVTPADTTAIINIGKLGSIKLAPGTTLNLTFDENGISGDLIDGRVSVLNSADSVRIITLEGKLVRLNAGESAAVNTQDDDDDDDAGAGAWFVWALVFGGAAAGLIIAATQGNDIQLGGGATVVSPRR